MIQPPHYFNLLLGNIACAQPDLLHLGVMIRDLPPGSLWSVAGIGDAQLMMNTVSLAAGGGVRIGLEDNIWFDRSRTVLATNTMLVQRIRDLTAVYGREIMPPQELRTRLEMEPGHGRYGRERR